MPSPRHALADPDAPDFVAKPREGVEVATRLCLALERYVDSGTSGCVHLLADGRVLKVTGSHGEAARALLLMEAQEEGCGCPGFPRIDRVVAMRSSVDVAGEGYEVLYYAIVREEAADLDNGWAGGSDLPHWMMALGMLGEARLAGSGEVPDLGPAAHCAAHVADAYDAIAWAAAELGFAVDDVRTSNFGIAGGRFVIRDFGPDGDAADVSHTVARIERIPDRPCPAPAC